MAGLVVRSGLAGDYPAIADIHAASWRQTYRGLFPDDCLDDTVPGLMQSHWDKRLQGPEPGAILLVSEDAGQVIGFWYGFPESEGVFEIDNLHVCEGHRGRTIGERLMFQGARMALADGHRAAVLWVIEGNNGALRFYGRLGGITGTPEASEIPALGLVKEVPVRFADLSALVAK